MWFMQSIRRRSNRAQVSAYDLPQQPKRVGHTLDLSSSLGTFPPHNPMVVIFHAHQEPDLDGRYYVEGVKGSEAIHGMIDGGENGYGDGRGERGYGGEGGERAIDCDESGAGSGKGTVTCYAFLCPQHARSGGAVGRRDVLKSSPSQKKLPHVKRHMSWVACLRSQEECRPGPAACVEVGCLENPARPCADDVEGSPFRRRQPVSGLFAHA
jgi:hypothetical protein